MRIGILFVVVVALVSVGSFAGGIGSDDWEDVSNELWREYESVLREERADEVEGNFVRIGERIMRYGLRSYGEKPKGGWSMFLSLHGGGAVLQAMNNQQWLRQIRLGDDYAPENALYVAPRAPTDSWNMWHQEHIDALLVRLIQNLVVLKDVNPNKVYLMGYSSGGNGVYQLSPRMAERFAAAAMMAGHPHDSSPLGLRNLPFGIHVGEKDGAYGRNDVAREWKGKLDELQAVDPEGYSHKVCVHEGKGHWMELADKEAIPWLQGYTRNPLPKRVVWFQDDVVKDSFYWLALPEGTGEPEQHIVATIKEQTIRIEKADGVRKILIRLNDRLLDLDHPVVITGPDGSALHTGRIQRSREVAEKTLVEKGDPELVFFAEIEVALPESDSRND